MTKNNFIALFDKYLNGTASESERGLVDEYLTRLEANQTAIPEVEEQAIKGEMWGKILMETTQQAKPLIKIAWYKRKAIRQIAVAASILLMVGLSILFLQNNNKTGDEIVAVPNGWQADSTRYFVRHEVNITGKERNLKLIDGTMIVLYNNSELTYTEPFKDKRDITLIGKAFFKVAKDKTRPFTVFSGDISTTALGTEFDITAYRESSQMKVRLYEGKVVVKAINKADKRMKTDVYLLPGQEFVYGGQTMAKVNNFIAHIDSAAEQNINDEPVADRPSVPKDDAKHWYMFNNQSLEKVLDNLSSLYNQKILYNKNDVKKIYFTGKYNKSDSLETILKRIAVINNLKIIKNDTAFMITK